MTIEECDADGTRDSSAVAAGSAAYFLVSVGESNMPAHGDVKVFYNTQDGKRLCQHRLYGQRRPGLDV